MPKGNPAGYLPKKPKKGLREQAPMPAARYRHGAPK
jgi:hypothetical protein